MCSERQFAVQAAGVSCVSRGRLEAPGVCA